MPNFVLLINIKGYICPKNESSVIIPSLSCQWKVHIKLLNTAHVKNAATPFCYDAQEMFCGLRTSPDCPLL